MPGRVNTLRVLALGDIVGKIGRQAVLQLLPGVKAEMKVNLVVAQAENLAHGIGVTRDTLEEVRAAGIDVFTGGNHVFQKQGREVLADPAARLLRPANYPEAPGTGWAIFPVGGVKVALINLQGQVFMKETVNNPFTLLETILKGLPQDIAVILVDFHAEATSEKVAMGWQADLQAAGRQVSAVWGTHTQVPTADARVLPGGTGCVTDLGMSGVRDGVIGVAKDGILRTFRTGLSEQHVIPDTGVAVFNACLFEINSETGKCLLVNRIDREVTIG
ncbi:MAG: TIGR00282 family metallophosphoesterase [Patescibacteria group bacterium]